jgi:hypothetical protein
MKKESMKFLILGLIVIFILIIAKNLLLPEGMNSFLLDVIIALIVGFFVFRKINSI